MYLKQSTAVTIKLGPFTDASDGVTEEVALTPAVELAKNGGAFAARNDATAVAHDAEGWYDIVLDATDTNTLGILTVKAQDSANHVPVFDRYTVLPANVYDSMIGGTDALQVHANEISNNLITSAAINDGAITAAKIDTDAITAAKVAADAGVEIAAAVWDRVLTGATHNITNSAGRRLRSIPETIGGSVDDATPSAAEFATSLAGAYSDDHFNDQTIRFTSGAAAGEVAVIVDYVDLTGTITLDEALANTPGNTDTFEILSTHVHPKSQIADVVLDELLSGHSTAGSLGKAVTDILADTGELQTDLANGGRLDLLIDAILEDTGTALPATLAALNDLSAADVNAEVVDVLRTDTIPDSYSTDGDQPTIAQGILEIRQFLQERLVSGTTVTVKKPNGTEAMTFTLDDATTPTSITRAS